jgi:hypothetical protein
MNPGTSVPDVRLTVTMPSEHGDLGALLRARHPEMVETVDVFRHVALQASERLIFVVPFFDLHGALLLLRLFEETRAPNRILICRDVEDLRGLNAAIDIRLVAAKVSLRVYNVPHVRDNGSIFTETFHAKIALADTACAYVGSANAMRSSLETTMECGFLVRGTPAGQVKDLVEALLEQTRGA